jgi:hypothetical protein
LTDGIEKKSYRYQLGVAVAIAESKAKISADAADALQKLFDQTKDSTLRNVLKPLMHK